MEDIKIDENIIFSIFCPYLKRTVTLKEKTWRYHIIKEHPEVNNYLVLIKQVLSKDEIDILKYRKKKDNNKIAIFKKCHHFLPYGNYLKIAFKLAGNKEAIVTTAESVYNLPSLNEMEEIK